MILQEKMDELKSFVLCQHEELQKFLHRWHSELRTGLGLPVASVGSADATVDVATQPYTPDVPPGRYETIDGLNVEVLSQDPSTRLLVLALENPDSPQEKLQSISPGLFTLLFKPAKAASITSNLALVDHEFEYQPDPGLVERMTAWSESFDWPSIHSGYNEVCDRLVKLDRALAARNKIDSQTCFIEALFLFYLFGNRLGYSADGHFKVLHETIFSLVDPDIEGALQTQLLYKQEHIETDFREFVLYDPTDVAREPLRYFLTYAVKDHYFPNALPMTKGCFLKARR